MSIRTVARTLAHDIRRSPARAVALCALSWMLVAASGPLLGQASPVEIGYQDRVESKILGETYELFVYLPPDYGDLGNAEGPIYPVLYVMDGRPSFRYTAGIVHGLAESGSIPRMIVVGIVNNDRWRDMTPTHSDEIAASGGGDRFLAMIRGELIPHIDHRYRTRDWRIFAGHSLGGLMSMQALMTMPDAFDAYIAGSPSLEWEDAAQVDRFREFLESRKQLDSQLFLYLGDERVEREPFFELIGILERSAPPGLDWGYEIDTAYTHLGIRVPGTLAALEAIFADWDLTSEEILSMSDTEIAAFYDRASVKYGVERELGFINLIEAGYWGVHHRATAARGMEIFEQLVERFPDSPFSHDSLGEGYERTGQLEKAKEKFEVAYAMALEQEGSDLDYFKGHLDRINEKLGD